MMNEEEKLIYEDLKGRYKKSSLSKAEMAHEMGVSYSTIDNYIARGYGIPNYKKLGNAKNAKVIFNIVDAAKFLADTIKTL
jgi:lambda repressor-like predicted transcriptional regulator